MVRPTNMMTTTEGVRRPLSKGVPKRLSMHSHNIPEPCPNILKTFCCGAIRFEGVTPSILKADFGETISESQWVVESYALLFVILMLAGDAFGDWFG